MSNCLAHLDFCTNLILILYQVGWYPFLNCSYPSTGSADFGPLCNPSLSRTDKPHWHPLFVNLQTAFKFRLDSVGWLACRWSSLERISHIRLPRSSCTYSLSLPFTTYWPVPTALLKSRTCVGARTVIPDYRILSAKKLRMWLCVLPSRQRVKCICGCWGKLYSSRDVPTRMKFAALILALYLPCKVF